MTLKAFIGSGSTGIVGILNTVVAPSIIALAFLIFIYGVVKYFFLHGTDEKEREKGREFTVWGVLGLVVLFSVWGLVNILLSTLGFAR